MADECFPMSTIYSSPLNNNIPAFIPLYKHILYSVKHAWLATITKGAELSKGNIFFSL